MIEIKSKQDVWGSVPVSSPGKHIFDLTMHLKVDLSSVTHPGSPSLIFSVLRLIKTLQAPYPQTEEREMEVDSASWHRKFLGCPCSNGNQRFSHEQLKEKHCLTL